MKKASIIGIVIAIIIAGALGIYAVSMTEEPIGDETSMGFEEEVTATIEEDSDEESAEFGFEEEVTATIEEDSDEEKSDNFGFGESATATVVNP